MHTTKITTLPNELQRQLTKIIIKILKYEKKIKRKNWRSGLGTRKETIRRNWNDRKMDKRPLHNAHSWARQITTIGNWNAKSKSIEKCNMCLQIAP